MLVVVGEHEWLLSPNEGILGEPVGEQHRNRVVLSNAKQMQMLIRLTPESQLEEPCRYGAAGLFKDHARVSRSIVLTRGVPRLLGTVSLA